MSYDLTYAGPVAVIDTENYRTLRIQCRAGAGDPSSAVVEVKRAWSPRFDSPAVSFATTETLTLNGTAITEIDVTDIGWVHIVVTTAVSGASFDFEYALDGPMSGQSYELPINMDAAGLRGFVAGGYKVVAVASAREVVTTGVLELKQAMGASYNAVSFSPAASMTLDGSTVTSASASPGGLIYAACTTAQSGLGADLFIYVRDEVVSDSASGGGGGGGNTGYFNVFAEESGSISTGTSGGFQWSFGDGDVADGYGIVIPFASELVAISLSVDQNPSGTCTVEVYKGADADSTSSSTGVDVSLSSGELHNYADFTGSPVTVNAGDWITFKTTAISGTITGGRVSAWFELT